MKNLPKAYFPFRLSGAVACLLALWCPASTVTACDGLHAELREKIQSSSHTADLIQAVSAVAAIGQSAPAKVPKGIFGRILRGRKAAEFQTLSDDASRKIVFFTDSRGINTIAKRSASHRDVLRESGFPEKYITELVDGGYSFGYLLFRPSFKPLPATWKNVIEMVSRISPEAGRKCRAHLNELQTMKFSEIEAQRPGASMATTYGKGRKDPGFMTLERFVRGTGSLFDVRSFLFHEAHLNELFTGNGYTLTPQGRRGIPEYVWTNAKVSDLGSSRLVPINPAN